MSDERLLDTIVELADTLIDDFEVMDFLHLLVDRCVELLDADAVGILLEDSGGRLQLVAASDEQVRLLELFLLQNDEGPCLDAFAYGVVVSHPDLSTAQARWPQFAPAAVLGGFAAVDAFPMRLRTDVIGVLSLFRAHPGELDPTVGRMTRALVDVATIGLLQERSIRSKEILTEQLQAALNSRVIIEQAKGLIAERFNLDMADAFTALRNYARRNGIKLGAYAHSIVTGERGTEDLLPDTSMDRPRHGD
ncbi:ANTAR domain-containing protein [Pseudonocardiaceae bacterium YIM PH 21723]|nr:ANTAR domain-containing protein [Pseudonocardiaceae bacterium YIM PH 21723]